MSNASGEKWEDVANYRNQLTATLNKDGVSGFDAQQIIISRSVSSFDISNDAALLHGKMSAALDVFGKSGKIKN